MKERRLEFMLFGLAIFGITIFVLGLFFGSTECEAPIELRDMFFREPLFIEGFGYLQSSELNLFVKAVAIENNASELASLKMVVDKLVEHESKARDKGYNFGYIINKNNLSYANPGYNINNNNFKEDCLNEYLCFVDYIYDIEEKEMK